MHGKIWRTDFLIGDAGVYQFKPCCHLTLAPHTGKQIFLKKSFMAPFYGWGSTASRLEPLQGGSLLFTTGNSWYSLTSEGWKAKSNLSEPSGFEHKTPPYKQMYCKMGWLGFLGCLGPNLRNYIWASNLSILLIFGNQGPQKNSNFPFYKISKLIQHR